MKRLFIYIDFNFSFSFGHYFNIFNNLYEKCCSEEIDFCLVHDNWKYHSNNADIKFASYKLQRIKAGEENYVNKIINEVDLDAYDAVNIYIYKGRIEYNRSLHELEKKLRDRSIPYRIINTMFIIPFEELDVVANEFQEDYENVIKEQMEYLADSSIEMAFDVERSIWNKYIDNVLFLPPPLLVSSELFSKTSDPNKLVIGFDVWNLLQAPKYRNENLDYIKDLVRFLVDNYSDIRLKIKIADSSYEMDGREDKIFRHPKVEIVRFLSPDEYDSYIKSCDIYILQYSPQYYKNKSSGHFIELIQQGIFIIGTRDTFLEEYLTEFGDLYEYGNKQSLIDAVKRSIDNFSGNNVKYDTSELKKLLYTWTPDFFYETALGVKQDIQISRSNNNVEKQTHKPFIILGNGPSLKGFDFKELTGYDTVGMNAAYRYWDKIDWYPTYYICLDTVVVKSHHEEIKRLIDRSDEYGIQKFFLRDDFFIYQPELEHHPKVITYEEMKDQNPLAFDCVHVTTGSFAARFAIYEGYRKLLMLGIDETYINFIPESKRKENITLEITDTPSENPNYFFADYQQKGDEYQIANHSYVYRCPCKHCNGDTRHGEFLHVDAWKFIKMDLANNDFIDHYSTIEIINCNPESAVKFFPFDSYQSAIAGPMPKQSPIKAEKTVQQKSPAPSPSTKSSFGGIILPMVAFMGNDNLVEPEKKLNGILDDQDEYTIDIVLRSFYNRTSFMSYSKTSPPMPFLIGHFAIYDFGTKFQINISKDGKAPDIVSFRNTLSWIQIAINYNKTKDKISVTVDGRLVGEFQHSGMKFHRDKLILGCGFEKRYWKGEINSLNIYNAKGKTIYHLDQSNVGKLMNHEGGNDNSASTIKDKSVSVPMDNAQRNVSKPEVSASNGSGSNHNVKFHSSHETCQDRWVVEQLNALRDGFFIDLGASDGRSANNTLTLEKSFGWKGILIEGNEHSYKKLINNRPNQICINAIVSDEVKDIVWRDNDTVLTRSGIDDTLPPDNDAKSWREGDKVVRQSVTLESILDNNKAPKTIDFLAIDIEGGEINALIKFPFDKYYVKLMSIEVSFKHREAVREIIKKGGFTEVKNPHCSATYEFFFVNNNLS